MSKIVSAYKLARQPKRPSWLNAWVSTRDSISENVERHRASVRANARTSGGRSARLLAVKDNICTTKEPTTCASAMLQGFLSPFAATIIKKLEAAGVVIAGKTNLDEFGMGYVPLPSLLSMLNLIETSSSDSIHSIHGPVQNWYMRDGDSTSAGGSSGGSSVAVATCQCHELVLSVSSLDPRLTAIELSVQTRAVLSGFQRHIQALSASSLPTALYHVGASSHIPTPLILLAYLGKSLKMWRNYSVRHIEFARSCQS